MSVIFLGAPLNRSGKAARISSCRDLQDLNLRVQCTCACEEVRCEDEGSFPLEKRVLCPSHHGICMGDDLDVVGRSIRNETIDYQFPPAVVFHIYTLYGYDCTSFKRFKKATKDDSRGRNLLNSALGTTARMNTLAERTSVQFCSLH